MHKLAAAKFILSRLCLLFGLLAVETAIHNVSWLYPSVYGALAVLGCMWRSNKYIGAWSREKEESEMHNPWEFLLDWICELFATGEEDDEILGIGAATEHPLDRV